MNLTVSSLTALANALDLELVLVPRKVAPAIRTITRSINAAPKTLPGTGTEIAHDAADAYHARAPRPAYRLDGEEDE